MIMIIMMVIIIIMIVIIIIIKKLSLNFKVASTFVSSPKGKQ